MEARGPYDDVAPAGLGHPPAAPHAGPARMALTRATAGPARRVAGVGRTSGPAPLAD
jgi:hypothetical protein